MRYDDGKTVVKPLNTGLAAVFSIEGYYAGFDDGRTLRCAETAKSAGGLMIGVDWITHIAQVRNMVGTSCSACATFCRKN